MAARILQFPLRTDTPAAAEDREKRSHLIALASQFCTKCEGTSIQQNGSDCPCAYRAICRGVIRRWRDDHHRKLSTRNNRRGWDMPSVEFCTDVIGVARKSLDPAEWRVWESAVLDRLTWKAAIDKLGMAKGAYFHTLYRAEAKLGRAFIDALPYELYPVANYYSILHKDGVKPNDITPKPTGKLIEFKNQPAARRLLAMAA
jgi:hypothetical protein